MVDAIPPQRIVPGAPPPPPLSKSQKKKRKSVKPKVADAHPAESILAIPETKSAALVEKAPEEADVKIGVIAEEPIAPPEPIQDLVASKKPSPVVELLNKRIKVQTKKLSRIAVYSSKPAELNEDQRKSVASLPSIQGAVRELEETRKAIEALEVEEAKEHARQRAVEEKTTNVRIAQAISDMMASHQQRLSDVLSLLRLSTLLSSADPSTFSLVIDEKERQVLHAMAETLLGHESPKKEQIISGLLLDDVNIDGIPYGRLLEVVESHRSPATERESTPIPEDPVPQPDPQAKLEDVEASKTVAAESPAALVEDSIAPVTSSGSFHFMQESELEGASLDQSAEWVEKPEEADLVVPAPVPEAAVALTIIDTGTQLGVNGKHIEEPPLSAVSAALDWAADDGDGLPSINSLHAKFGTSGNATPEASPQDSISVAEPVVAQAQPERGWSTTTGNWDAPVANGNLTEEADLWGAVAPGDSQIDEEGFVKAKVSRGRYSDHRTEFRGGERSGRVRGGFRGERGGEYRSYRGRGGGDSFGAGWRGGDGEHRGRGAFRGDRGRGGEFRGGDFRGRGGRGGEFRGRGRGDRGAHRGGRGGFDGNPEAPAQTNP